MKIKSIAAICKKNKQVVLFNRYSDSGTISQYIGDGSAVYPISGLPELDEESILTIFDVPEKQREDWLVRYRDIPEGISFEDTDTTEKIIEQGNLSIVYSGKTLKPLQTRRGLVFIESRYLSPVSDVLDVLELYERVTPFGAPYIVAKAGFLLQAVIMPCDVIQNAAGWLYEQVTGFFGGIVDGVKNFLGIHSPSTVFADIGGNMAAGVGEGFGGGMDTVSADMQGAMGSAGTITAQEAVQAVNDGIIANIGALDGAVSAIVERVTTGLTAQAARLNQIGVDMTKYIASGMTTGTPNITNIIPQIVQSIITAFTAQQPKFTAAGVDIDKAIASGMVQGTPQITAKIPQIIQSILTTINGFVSQFTAAGEEMVRGIWQGFQNMSGWLESKVRSMMREIVAAVEAEMQIASPSKVFAGIGAYMAEGLGEGFAREMQNVEKTIRRATASTVPEPQRPSGRIGRNDNAARGVQVVQNIYANETSYAQQQREAAKQFRLIAREVMG